MEERLQEGVFDGKREVLLLLDGDDLGESQRRETCSSRGEVRRLKGERDVCASFCRRGSHLWCWMRRLGGGIG